MMGKPVLYVTWTVRSKREYTALSFEDTSALRFDITFVADCDCRVCSLLPVAVAVCAVGALLLKWAVLAISVLLVFGRAIYL